jgi:branched-chain amino acid transport system ATP-binding protein
MSCVLSVENLHAGYGAIRAVRGITMHVNPGEVIAVIGANGAGKTTLLRALANEVPRSEGNIVYRNKSTAGVPTHRLASAGLLHIPEGRGTFPTLTVLENLRLAFERVMPPIGRFEQRLDIVFGRFPRLREKQRQLAGNLSGGEQQMLALARALLVPPDLLLLDEPSLGLAPAMVSTVFSLLEELRAEKLTMVVVEQNSMASLKLADRAYLIRRGQIVLEGDAKSMAQSAEFSDLYFGQGDTEVKI